jgi:hypothetical protein
LQMLASLRAQIEEGKIAKNKAESVVDVVAYCDTLVLELSIVAKPRGFERVC